MKELPNVSTSSYSDDGLKEAPDAHMEVNGVFGGLNYEEVIT